LNMQKKTIFLVLICFGIGLIFSLFFSILKRERSQSQQTITKTAQQRKTTEKANRIICVSPGITEIVFALGCGDRVVGVSHFSTYPPEVKEKAKIGGLINPNRERIIKLKPDLLITQGKHESVAKLCRELGIRFISIRIDRLRDIPDAIILLGRELKVEELAVQLVKKIRDDLAFIQSRTAERPARKIFLCLGHTPGDLTGLMTTGPGTFLHELIEIAGGENIFSDAAGLYPQISKESLLKRQPDVIIEVCPKDLSEEKLKLLKNDWKRLPSLPAVRMNHIYFLSDDFIQIPGIRIAQTALRFAAIIHPEALNE